MNLRPQRTIAYATAAFLTLTSVAFAAPTTISGTLSFKEAKNDGAKKMTPVLTDFAGRAYTVSDRATGKAKTLFDLLDGAGAGKHVTLTGELDGMTLTVSSIRASSDKTLVDHEGLPTDPGGTFEIVGVTHSGSSADYEVLLGGDKKTTTLGAAEVRSVTFATPDPKPDQQGSKEVVTGTLSFNEVRGDDGVLKSMTPVITTKAGKKYVLDSNVKGQQQKLFDLLNDGGLDKKTVTVGGAYFFDGTDDRLTLEWIQGSINKETIRIVGVDYDKDNNASYHVVKGGVERKLGFGKDLAVDYVTDKPSDTPGAVRKLP